jgi:hypothetical protein
MEIVALLPVAAAGSHPLTPFVVGDCQGGNEDNNEDDEEDLHDETSCQLQGPG